jgi:hypothetical protein
VCSVRVAAINIIIMHIPEVFITLFHKGLNEINVLVLSIDFEGKRNWPSTFLWSFTMVVNFFLAQKRSLE